MTNRDGADIQEARKYVTSKQSNINNAANSASNSSANNSTNSGASIPLSSGFGNLSSSTVSGSRPMEATIEEARKLNKNQGMGNMK